MTHRLEIAVHLNRGSTFIPATRAVVNPVGCLTLVLMHDRSRLSFLAPTDVFALVVQRLGFTELLHFLHELIINLVGLALSMIYDDLSIHIQRRLVCSSVLI